MMRPGEPPTRESAENLFQKVVEQNPNDSGAYFYLAMVTWSRLASGFWSPENVQEYDRNGT